MQLYCYVGDYLSLTKARAAKRMRKFRLAINRGPVEEVMNEIEFLKTRARVPED